MFSSRRLDHRLGRTIANHKPSAPTAFHVFRRHFKDRATQLGYESAFNACSSVCLNADSLVWLLSLSYCGAIATSALSHFLTVGRDIPVTFAISLIVSFLRSRSRLTLPIMSMVITFIPSC
jgi:hypothetical protein